MRRLLTTLLAALALAFGALVAPPVSADVTVIGDDKTDAFVGSGSLLLPSSMFANGRTEAADCPGCSWRAVVQCEMTTAGSCRGPARLCGSDATWLRIYMTRPTGEEVDLGAACFGSGGPTRREDAEQALRQVIEESVPALRPSLEPPGGILPHLPVIFTSGQPEGTQISQHTIIGLPVELSVTPVWRWEFGDGTGLSTKRSGSGWPDLSVSHVYDRAGDLQAAVRTEWSASYVVDGIGPLHVAEPVTQEATLPVPVGEGRAVLVR